MLSWQKLEPPLNAKLQIYVQCSRHHLTYAQLFEPTMILRDRCTQNTDCRTLRSVDSLKGEQGACLNNNNNNNNNNSLLPLGHHTLGIECKGVLSTGVDRMLVGNRVGVGLTRSTINSFALFTFPITGAKKNCPHGSEPPCGGDWVS